MGFILTHAERAKAALDRIRRSTTNPAEIWREFEKAMTGVPIGNRPKWLGVFDRGVGAEHRPRKRKESTGGPKQG